MPCNIFLFYPFSEEGELIPKSVLIALLWILDEAQNPKFAAVFIYRGHRIC